MSFFSQYGTMTATLAAPPPSGPVYSPLMAETVTNSGGYDSFPQYLQRDGELRSCWLKKSTHTSKGLCMIGRRTSSAWVHTQANVDGTLIESYANSYGLTVTGREILFYQDDDTFATIKWATRDGGTGNFTYRGTISAGVGYDWIAPAPIKNKRLPDGKQRFGFYKGDNAGTTAFGGFYDSDDNGISFDFTSTLYDRSTQAPTAPYTDWMLNEFDWECVNNTGVNSTSEYIAIGRVALPTEGGTYYAYFTSTDAINWTQSTTEDAGIFVDDNGNTVGGPFSRGILFRFLASNSPCNIKLFNGVVYVANGERNPTYGYARKLTTTTPTGAMRNKFDDWTAPVDLGTYQSNLTGGTIDCGYIDMEEVTPNDTDPNELWAQDYDNNGNAGETLIKQFLIATIP